MKDEPMKCVLRITLMKDGHTLKIQAQSQDRFKQHGFGTFLSNVMPGEVEITKDAFDAIMSQPGRSGLQGLEFWDDRRLAWGSLHQEFQVHCDSINVPDGAKLWIPDCFKVIEEGT